MTRLAALIVLGTMLVPFARAPLCQAGSHEHPEDAHAMHVMSAPAMGAADTHGGDCHEKMMCEVAADLVVLPAFGEDDVGAALVWATPWRARTAPAVSTLPELPPPRRI